MMTAYNAARALVPVPGMARARSGSSTTSWGTLVVWRVRFWLLALVVVLAAANSRVEVPPEQAGRVAASQAGCAVPKGRTARTFASLAPQPRLHNPVRAGSQCDPAVL
jgi:hypothetical protein